VKALALLLVAGVLGGLVVQETNSHAAASRGVKAYDAKQYDAAAAAFRKAQQLRPSPESAFNLGTAEIAAGRREEGSAILAEALKNPVLRADALYNRGNSALAAKAFDHAIRDYKDALRARPDFAEAKRNLEIALARRDSAQQEASGKQKGGGNQQQQQPQQPAPGQKQAPKRGQADLEALLRSVQQQEQEELSRMKRVPAERRVGW
jgi:Ca-activated chloride channel family protein